MSATKVKPAKVLKVKSGVADLRRMTARDVIKRPIITEKSMGQSADNKYTFEVDLRANKIQIRNAIKEIFGVDAIKVTTNVTGGKTRRKGRKDEGVTSDFKKAVVSLKEGQTIELEGKPLFEV